MDRSSIQVMYLIPKKKYQLTTHLDAQRAHTHTDKIYAKTNINSWWRFFAIIKTLLNANTHSTLRMSRTEWQKTNIRIGIVINSRDSCLISSYTGYTIHPSIQWWQNWCAWLCEVTTVISYTLDMCTENASRTSSTSTTT